MENRSEEYRFMKKMYKVLKRHEEELTHVAMFGLGFMLGILVSLQLGIIRYEPVENEISFVVDNISDNVFENVPEVSP